MKKISILGSTGSIGCNALEIVARLREDFTVVGLAAGRNVNLLLEQAEKFRPRIVSLESRKEAEEFKRRCKISPIRITFGQEGAEEVSACEENDVVVSAITGISGLRPTLAAVRKGKRVALANKESMVVAGGLLQVEARKAKAEIIPVDSEHSGIFQCLAKEEKKSVKRVVLTASGGPFLKTPLGEIKNKTLEETLRHPRWKMGKKVTVDSATMMNKGLELIEARWLFNLKPRQLEVLIHPQSIVHSLVEFKDGAILAQLSPTDMKIPIQYALTYPSRGKTTIPSLDLAYIRTLEFFEIDEERFPLFHLARQALEEGGSFAVALNAANEVAVDAFLKRRLKFADIAEVVKEIMGTHRGRHLHGLEEVFEVDRETRREAEDALKRRF